MVQPLDDGDADAMAAAWSRQLGAMKWHSLVMGPGAALGLPGVDAAATLRTLDFGTASMHANLPVPRLVELALARGEGVLASNGALACDTGDRTGRSPNDKFLEDTAGIHGNIDWGKVNQAITPANFEALEALAMDHLRQRRDLFRFDGYAGADPAYRCNWGAPRAFLDAPLAASRKVTDAGWLPRSVQVGITGATVAPQLYLAIGTSGRFNHAVGFRNADTVVAVDRDPAAPIFDVADLGIVGDWREVVPRLVEAIAAIDLED